jgi:hypothetical protein
MDMKFLRSTEGKTRRNRIKHDILMKELRIQNLIELEDKLL